jgi:hypothetical protein
VHRWVNRILLRKSECFFARDFLLSIFSPFLLRCFRYFLAVTVFTVYFRRGSPTHPSSRADGDPKGVVCARLGGSDAIFCPNLPFLPILCVCVRVRCDTDVLTSFRHLIHIARLYGTPMYGVSAPVQFPLMLNWLLMW